MSVATENIAISKILAIYIYGCHSQVLGLYSIVNIYGLADIVNWYTKIVTVGIYTSSHLNCM